MDDPELRLVIDACRAAYEGGQPAIAQPQEIRWDRVLALADRHRVQALCWHGLGGLQPQVPDAIAGQFASETRQIVGENLRTLAECAKLRISFEAAEVDLIFLKGLALASLAYPNPMLKMGWDIDLLIAPDQLQMAVDLLRGAGYQLELPHGADDVGLARWHSTRKESMWFAPEGGFILDLHTRVANHPRVLPGLGMTSPRQLVPVAGTVELPTLGGDELFAYLCVHGASSAWFRLKWLVDLAALLHRQPANTIELLYERSQQLGAGRAAGQALVLLQRLFGLRISAELSAQLEGSAAVRRMAAIAEAQLSNPREPTERFLGTATIHLSQALLLPGLRFKLSELGRQAREIVTRRA